MKQGEIGEANICQLADSEIVSHPTASDFFRLARAVRTAPRDSLEVRRVWRRFDRDEITAREAAELLEALAGVEATKPRDCAAFETVDGERRSARDSFAIS